MMATSRRPKKSSRTVYDLLDDYLLTHEMVAESAHYYRRMVGVLCSWAKCRVPLRDFTVDLINRLLVDKERAGLTSSYRRSIRAAMRALLAFHAGGPITGQLRRVKLTGLVVEVWTAAEVQRLIDACNFMPNEKRRLWWQTQIAAGYYTGFSNIDLWKLTPKQIDAAGRVAILRSKTGKPVSRKLPEPWLTAIRDMSRGQKIVWGRSMTTQVFQATFRRIAKKAGLTGTFKKLRKSCGTSVEMAFPGRGHIALGNTRQVFERHYFDMQQLNLDPMIPDDLPSVPTDIPAKERKPDAAPVESQKLMEFFDNTFVPSRLKGKSDCTLRFYRTAIHNFARYLECEPRLSDLSDAKVASFLDWLSARKYSPWTVLKEGVNLTALWKLAFQLRLTDVYPTILRKRSRR